MTNPAQIRAKISTMETVTLRHDPLAVPKVHESTVEAMSVNGSPTGPVCRVHIYTDGSFKEADSEASAEAAWALVVILEHTGTEYSFHWFAAGSVAVGNQDAHPPAWVGALKAGCDTAEIAGITWACRWGIDRMCVELGSSGLPVVLHVDSQRVISSVNGHGRPVANVEAVHYARAAKCILETFSSVTLQWCAGHSGHPWNELADPAAKQTAHDFAMSATRHVGDVDPSLARRQLDWFFLARLAQYPTIVDGVFSVTNHEEVLSSKEVASVLDCSAKNVSVGSALRTKAISLREASANVLLTTIKSIINSKKPQICICNC